MFYDIGAKRPVHLLHGRPDHRTHPLSAGDSSLEAASDLIRLQSQPTLLGCGGSEVMTRMKRYDLSTAGTTLVITSAVGATTKNSVCRRLYGAGDRDRTDDIQLGKLTFYH